MFAVYKIKFVKALPSSTQVLAELNRVTGLGNVRYTNRGKKDFIVTHELFPIPEFSLDFEDDELQVVIWTTNPRINYLLEATIASLQNLGGTYAFQINELARKKWIDVKDSYQERLIVKDPYLDPLSD